MEKLLGQWWGNIDDPEQVMEQGTNERKNYVSKWEFSIHFLFSPEKIKLNKIIIEIYYFEFFAQVVS